MKLEEFSQCRFEISVISMLTKFVFVALLNRQLKADLHRTRSTHEADAPMDFEGEQYPEAGDVAEIDKGDTTKGKQARTRRHGDFDGIPGFYQL